MGKVTQEELQDALNLLDGLTKSENDELNTDKENLNKGEGGSVEDLVKSLGQDLNSKLQSIGAVTRYLISENESLAKANAELKDSNEQIIKSLSSLGESLESITKIEELVSEMANSPFNKLSGTLKKSIAVEKFAQEKNDGKEVLSLTNDKRKVLNLLEKSLSTEEGQRRLGNVVGLIENGYVNNDNYGFLEKSVANEIGSQYKITL